MDVLSIYLQSHRELFSAQPCLDIGCHAPEKMHQNESYVTSLPQDPTADGSYSRSDSALAECKHSESESDTGLRAHSSVVAR